MPGSGFEKRRGSSVPRAAWALWILLTGVACAPFVPGRSAASKSVEEPKQLNILLLLADDHRFDALGVAGNGILETPHLDRLAEDGVRFTNAFCTTSICPTSRATFLTGQHVARHGIVNFSTGLSEAQLKNTWPGVLQTVGYRSAFVGKWGLGGHLPQAKFDYFHGFAGQGRYIRLGERLTPSDVDGPPDYFDAACGEHLTVCHGAVASRVLESISEPFFLQLSFKAPHVQDGETPFAYDPRFSELYEDVTIPAPISATESAFARLPEALQRSEGRLRWHQRFATEEQQLTSVRGYWRLINGIDEVVGRLRAVLKRLGLADRTVIVYSSDNGFFLGEHGLAGKWFPHEESIRIPLLIFDPRLPHSRRGTVVEEMVLNIDVAPTLIEYGGADVPAVVQGRSLRPLLAGDPIGWRQDWYYEHPLNHPRIPRSEALRTERWKLARYFVEDGTVEQLFDLETDPHELVDLARDPRFADRLAALRTRLEQLRTAAR